jgi:hypothetical protein
MSDIVKLYNPANAAALTPEQVEGLQKLTNEEIKELAKAYPNMTMQKAFLLIIDGSKPANRQIPTLSTYENLYNLRVKNGLKNYVAYAFKGAYKPTNIQPLKSRRTEVLDLSDTELLHLPGFRTGNQRHEAETITVTKIEETPKKAAKKSATKKSK